jgi:hypothetical protein
MPIAPSLAAVVPLMLLAAGDLFAAGGTTVVASKGAAATISATWPEGVGDLVNDAARTSGWRPWFTEWPNDVQHYAYDVKSTDEINALIVKLAATKSDVRQLRLSYLPEPAQLGWVTRLPDGNGIPVIFSVGDQGRVDEWYKNVRKPFGKMEFFAAPVAVPPTLTIFVQNKAVDLDKLTVPKGITVLSGNVPGIFHRFNTTDEAMRTAGPSASEKLNAEAQQAVDRITAFLKKDDSAEGDK